MNTFHETASFRDPSGFLFWDKNNLYRAVNFRYKDSYDQFINSGLYSRLIEEGLLVEHREVADILSDPGIYKVLAPRMLDFISYPYEWCFSQLKDAALTTLKIQKIAMEYNMSLKDSSAYNIQFHIGKPVLIDTLSFEKYREGKPWIAYRQFCQHFLAPLTLMSYKDVRLALLMRQYIDGIPLDLASSLLPLSSRFNLGVYMNIHLHCRTQRKYQENTRPKEVRIRRTTFEAMIDHLEATVRRLKWAKGSTEWGNYYDNNNYTDTSFNQKKSIVSSFLDAAEPSFVWDLGANTGFFSRLASEKGAHTIAFDIDPVAVENNYLKIIKDNEINMLPLLLDLANPTPGLGWNNEERMSLKQRKLPDTVMALALIHHLVISNNVPFDYLARFFSEICEHLIIEFVPKMDSQVQRMLAVREDIFEQYNQESFEKVFSSLFNIIKAEKIEGTERVIYLMRRKH